MGTSETQPMCKTCIPGSASGTKRVSHNRNSALRVIDTARRSLPKFANYLRKAKLSLFSSSTAHSGTRGRQAEIRDFMNA